MEHPGTDVNKIKEESLEHIQQKIGELYDRLNFAYRTANQPLINQLTMVMETYTRAQEEKVIEQYQDYHEGMKDKIKISSS